MQLREPGFEKWLKANAPIAGPSDASGSGSEVERAEEAFVRWPLLEEVECEYVDTAEKARIESPLRFKNAYVRRSALWYSRLLCFRLDVLAPAIAAPLPEELRVAPCCLRRT